MKRLIIIAIILSSLICSASILEYNTFVAYDPLIAYTYNQAGGLTENSGMMLSENTKEINVFTICTTINSASLVFTMRCSTKKLDWTEIYTYTYTAANCPGKKSVMIRERCYAVAVGVLATGKVAGDSISTYVDVNN